ncbi:MULTISPECIES: sulfatase family protein [unclassified Carboxylicivirga]|uniref:sulfatase family protein n=1 Tax=Carboxylicivirga TaxID=1628153 RepID=UPI003D32CD54
MVNIKFSHTRLIQVVCIVCLAAIHFGCRQSNTTIQQPNIIFIMSDDHATNAISAYGSHLAEVAPTPNIDRLAKEGVLLTNCYANNSICTPSRASILTGQYSHTNGVRTLSDQLDTATVHIAHHLRRGGYRTALIGKWHLHSEPQGFDYWNVLPDQGLYFNPEFIEKGLDENTDFHHRQVQTHEGYVSDVITDLSLNWLKEQPKDKPFMLMMHHKAPHALWEYHPKYKDLFDGIEIPEPTSLFEDMSHRSIATREVGNTLMRLAKRMSGQIKVSSVHDYSEWPTGKLHIEGLSEKEVVKATYQKYLKDYLRTVASVDESVGRIIDYLDENGLTDNTIVIYTSDQGMFLGEHQYLDKRWIFEEAIKMPFLMRYPGSLKPKTEIKELISNVDFAPTLLDFAGIEVPEEMQGRSFKPLLEGQAIHNWPTAVYYRYWMHRSTTPAHYGIRTNDYKLIFYYALNLDANNYGHPDSTPGWELYDLRNDPLEMNNVYHQPEYQDVITELKKQLSQMKAKIGDTDNQYTELKQRLNTTK